MAIYVAATTLIVSLLFLDNAIGARFRQVRAEVITMLCVVTGIFLVGLVDDLRGLPARFKFAAEVLGAGALCLSGVHIGSIDLGSGMEISLGWLAWPITVLWIVGVTNAVNMSDGMDGLAAGVAAIACGVIAFLAIHGTTIHTGLAATNDAMMALFSLALLGSLSGFLFFNWNPAKVFMGDCGSLFIGFTIASASVMCVSKSTALVGLALPALALGIPIFDTLFSMLRRFLERRSLFAPDRRHFHHRLLELGLNQQRAVLLIYVATLLATGLGCFMVIEDGVSSLVVFAGALFALLLLFRAVGVIRPRQILTRLQERHRRIRQERREREVFEQLELRFRRPLAPDQWWQAVCEAADRMEFAWISLKTTYADGRIEEELWRAPGVPPAQPRIVVTSVPLTIAHEGGVAHCRFEIAVWANGSLESAGRRVTRFGRLLDESRLASAGSP